MSVKMFDFNGDRVLITGGAGFIGSWLCEWLVKSNARVVCLDNLYTGRTENIAHLLGKKNFKFTKCDVDAGVPDESFDYIIHGASIPAPDNYAQRPVEAMLPNSVGLLNLLENARKHGSVLLYTSTSEVYGDAEVIPTPEAYHGKVNPVGVRSCYDEAKRFGEALCMAYHREYGVKVKIARIFNTYGPRMDPEARYARVIPRFIIQALKGEPITVHGDGKQTRSFCYISDMVVGLLKMLESRKCEGEVVNLGRPQETSIIELANLIRKLTGSSSPIVHQPPRPEDPKRRCPDISKARRLLEWEPTVPLEEGLKQTINWFKTIL